MIFDQLTFTEVMSKCLVDKTARTVCQSGSYWQYRAKMSGIFDIYFKFSYIFDPRIRYAWSVFMSFISSTSDLLGPDFTTSGISPDLVIYLSRNPNILFPGYHYLIGMTPFMKRCVDADNINLLSYAMSLGPSNNTIRDILKYAVETNHKLIAEHLSAKLDEWDEYNARYNPSGETNNYLLAKYGHYQLPDPDVVVFTQFEVTDYLTSLAERFNVKGIPFDVSQIEAEFIWLINKTILPRDEGIFVVSWHMGNSTIPMMKAYLDKVNEIDRRINKDYHFVVGQTLLAATEKDNVRLAEYIFNRAGEAKINKVYAKSVAMYTILSNSPNIDTITRYGGVFMGANYQLFYTIPSIWSVVVYLLTWDQDSVPLFMIETMIKKYQRLTLMSSNLFQLMKIYDKLYRGSNIVPYLYDFLRRLGMPKMANLLRLSTFADVNLLEYYKLDAKSE